LRSPSEGVAEGVGWGEEFRHARASRRAKRGGQVRFRFLDLCIKFGKIISKACPVGNLFSIGVCEGFNSGAKEDNTNSFFEDESVCPALPAGRSPSPANGGAGLRSATAKPSLWREMKRILMLSGEFNFFFLITNNTNL